jgi:hypothetical protein
LVHTIDVRPGRDKISINIVISRYYQDIISSTAQRFAYAVQPTVGVLVFIIFPGECNVTGNPNTIDARQFTTEAP